VLTPGRVAQVLKDADLFALPTHQESFGVTFLEAMRAGTAVLGTRLGTVTELVGDGGVFVTPGDAAELTAALRMLVADAAMRAELCDAGQRRYREQYAPEVATGRFEAAVTLS
jgi:glycosyltransferase involved in cell wall biosynthesis